MPTKKPEPVPPTARQARYRSSGRQVSAVITDEKALSKLDALTKKHGGTKAALEAALRGAPLRS